MAPRSWLLLVVGLALFRADARAIDYPANATLRLLAPELTLPENVEALKRAGVARAEIDLVLASVLHWWDDTGADLSWLPPEKATRAKQLGAQALCARRRLWRDRLLGEITESTLEQKRETVRREIHAQLAEYDLRAAPATAKVREWTSGLVISEEDVLWLATAEAERNRIASRSFVVGGRVSLASDAEAGELVRIRTAMLALSAANAATYLRRADSQFSDWARWHSADLGIGPEVALRLYAFRCSARLTALELHENRSVTVSQEHEATAKIYAETRSKVEALLGAEAFARYSAHELGRWMAGEVRKP